MHLVRPLGFSVDDKYLKRAGLDYWHLVDISVYENIDDYFAKNGYKIVFFGGKMDEELVQNAVEKMQEKAIIATGKFTIGELAAAMHRCALIITNDSGPMHVAISQKVPIVALYGPSHTELYGPYKANATVVRAIPFCDGCKNGMKHKCDDMRCMNDLTAEQVIVATKNKLGVDL